MLSIPSGKLDASTATTVLLPASTGPALPLQLQQALADDARRVWPYLLLALLLHLALLLLLGNAPGGTARSGEGAWGAINITLRGPATAATGDTQAQWLPEVPAGPRGDAARPRWGGTVRDVSPPAAAPPGAARQGSWAARPQAGAVDAAAQTAQTAPPAAPAPERDANGSVQPTLAVPLPAAPVAPVTPTVSPDSVSLPTALLPLTPAPAPTPVHAMDAAPVTPAPAAFSPAATAAPAPPKPPAPTPAPAPAPVVMEPAPLLLAPPLSGRPEAAMDRPLLPQAAPVPLPRRLAFPPLPALAPALPLVQQPAATTAVAAPALPNSSPAPAVAPTPVAAPPAAAAAAANETAPATSQAAAPAAAATRATTPASTPEPPTAAAPAAPAATPATAATTAAPAASTTPGQPDAGPRMGNDIATPPSAAASAVPRLNLQLVRPRGAELSRGGSTGLLPVLPRPPELPDKLARDIEKAGKADCRTAYAGAGLLAVVPLAVQAVRQDGCKW